MNAIFSKTMQDTETFSGLKELKVFLNFPKTCFSGVDDFLIDNYDLS